LRASFFWGKQKIFARDFGLQGNGAIVIHFDMSGPSMIDPALPLIDLHRHLDGSVRLETVLDLAQQHGIKLPASTVEELRPHVVVTEPQPGLMAFIAKML
jgi:hypothetical protein